MISSAAFNHLGIIFIAYSPEFHCSDYNMTGVEEKWGNQVFLLHKRHSVEKSRYQEFLN
jgi:hypothetical protein